MPNIKFNYLYRDAGNYKYFGYVVFKNQDNIGLVELQQLIKLKLIDGVWFYAQQWHMPGLFIGTTEDPTWHEFESMEYTDAAPTINISISDMI